MNEEVKNDVVESKEPTFEPNLESDGKERKNKSILLIIVALLIVALGLVGVNYLYNRNATNTENVYYAVIDNVENAMVKYIDNIDLYNKPFGNDITLNINGTSSDKEINNILNIIKDMSFNLNTKTDYQNKRISADYKISYTNSSLVNGNLYVNDENIYVNLGELYNKYIKLLPENTSDNDFQINTSSLWNAVGNKELKSIIEESSKILKESLKEEYFSRTEEKINVLGKEIDVYNHTLKLNETDIKEIIITFIDKLSKNDTIIANLKALTNETEETIKNALTELKNNIQIDPVTFESNIYMNKNSNKLEEMHLKINDEELSFIKDNEEVFNINYNSSKLGTVKVNDQSVTFTFNDTETNTNLVIELGDNKTALTLKAEGININLEVNKVSEDNTKVKFSFNGKIVEDNYNLTINIDIKNNAVDKVESKNVSNAVSIDAITEEESNQIINKLYNNSAFMTLMGKIASLN